MDVNVVAIVDAYIEIFKCYIIFIKNTMWYRFGNMYRELSAITSGLLFPANLLLYLQLDTDDYPQGG